MPLISDSIGRVLGKRYRLLSALGTGASAHVFLAEDVSLQRHVAVKVLQPGLATDEAFLKRFRAEARSVASLNHPHVLRVFDWGDDTDGPYLVLEYLGGGSLRDLLDRGRPALALRRRRSWGPRWPRAWPTRTPAGWCTVTSSRPTCSSTRRAGCGWPTSAWPAPWPRRPGPSRPARWSGRPATSRPRRPRASRVDGRADVYSLALVLYEAVTGDGALRDRHDHGHAGGPDRAAAAAPRRAGAARRRAGPGRGARRVRPGSTRPGWRPGWAPWRPRCRRRPRLPLVIPRLEHARRPIHGFRAPGVSELTDSGVRGGGCRDGHVLDGDRASVATATAAAPVGTKAGPGEIFDAEPFGKAGRDRTAGRPPAPSVLAAAPAHGGGSWRRSPWC